MNTHLLETNDAGESGERTGELVAVEHAKVRQAERKLPVRVRAMLKDQTVPGAVHRLEAKLLSLLPLSVRLLVSATHGKHVVLIMLPVTRRLPQLLIVYNRCHDLLHTGNSEKREAHYLY